MHKHFFIFLFIIPFTVFAFDYYFFVQLWPPSWLITDHNDVHFNNSYFTVHGIWPQYNNGSWPQFCNNSLTFNSSQLDPIKNKLEQYWTDFEHPEFLWKHEYLKHFSCCDQEPQFNTELDCFETGLLLREKYNMYQYLFESNITPNSTPILLDTVYDAVQSQLGYNVVIVCDNNDILNEIVICLDKQLRPFDCPYTAYNEQCKKQYVLYLQYADN